VAIQAQGSLNLGMIFWNWKIDLPLCLMCHNSSATDCISTLLLVWIKNHCRRLQGVLPASTTSMCACKHITMRVRWEPRGSLATLVPNLKSTQQSTTLPDVSFYFQLVLPTANVSCTTSHPPLNLNPQWLKCQKNWKSFSLTAVPIVQCYFYRHGASSGCG